MARLTFTLLWLLVLSLPWEGLFALGPIGTATRLIGLIAVGSGALSLVASGRLRQLGGIVILSFVFSTLALVSTLWTIWYYASYQQVTTCVQLAGLVWLVWQFASRRDQQQSLMLAYILGTYVSLAELFRNLATGVEFGGGRYSASNLDPNDFGLTMAIGIPLAWNLFLNRRGIVRVVAAAYAPLAVVGVLLTGSRGALIETVVALAIVPLTLLRLSLRTTLVTATVLVAAAGAAVLLVPQRTWDRLMTIGQELEGGTMSGRTGIWTAGAEAFLVRPLMGAGAGAFDAAVEPIIGPGNAAHNVFLAIVVEQGLLGLFVFLVLSAACGFGISRLPSFERKTWLVVVAVWMVGAMSLGWQYRKVTWWVVGMIAVVTNARSQRPGARADAYAPSVQTGRRAPGPPAAA